MKIKDKVLIVEDEPELQELLCAYLQDAGYAAAVAGDGAAALDLFRAQSFDLVLLDIMLPKIDGFGVCAQIRRQSQVPILMLTALGTADDKLEGFDVGADDYMVKPFDFRELLARVRVLLKRRAVAKVDAVKEISYADLCINLERQEVTRNGEPVKLSPKEYNLLVYLVENAERVVSRVEIAEKVWNTHFDTGTNFIDVYINYLRKKMDKNFEVKLIHTKPGVGFILTDKM